MRRKCLSILAASFVILLVSAGASRAQPAPLTIVSHWEEGYARTVAAQDSLVVVAVESDTSLVVLNVTDSAKLREVARMSSPSDYLFDAVLRDRYAYLAGGADKVSGTIFSAVDLLDPTDPFVADSASAEFREAAYHVRLKGDTAFVPAAAGLMHSHMYDISDPRNFVDLGNFFTVALDVAFSESALYVMEPNGVWQKRVATWSPLEFESLERLAPAEWRQSGEVLDDRLYMIGEGFHVYDVSSDTTLPERLGGLELSAAGTTCSSELTLANGLVYIAASEHGLVVVDASDEAEPRIIAQFDTACAEDVVVSDGLIFLAAGDEGLYVLRDDAEAWKATSSETPTDLPVSSHLESVFPNPSSGSVHVQYRLAQPRAVRLRVYDLLGRRVDAIDLGTRSAGRHELAWRSDGLSAGTYVIQLEMGAVRQSSFVHLVK